MRFGIVGNELGERWRWVAPFPERPKFKVELYRPKASEHLDVVTKFKIGRDDPDWGGFLKFLAKNWFRAFEGAEDANGVPLDNTESVRLLMLEEPSVGLMDAIVPLFRKVAEQDVEGKGDSDSV